VEEKEECRHKMEEKEEGILKMEEKEDIFTSLLCQFLSSDEPDSTNTNSVV
jgi:hypothetical protein